MGLNVSTSAAEGEDLGDAASSAFFSGSQKTDEKHWGQNALNAFKGIQNSRRPTMINERRRVTMGIGAATLIAVGALVVSAWPDKGSAVGTIKAHTTAAATGDQSGATATTSVSESDQQKALAYWTPERVAAVKPLPEDPRASLGTPNVAGSSAPDGPQVSAPAQTAGGGGNPTSRPPSVGGSTTTTGPAETPTVTSIGR